ALERTLPWPAFHTISCAVLSGLPRPYRCHLSSHFRGGLAMLRNPVRSCTRSHFVIAFLSLSSLVAVGPSSSAAQDLAKVNGSLGLVPENASFYSSMLRNREQIEAIGKSKAWAKLWNLPVVQMGWVKVREEWEKPAGAHGPLGLVREFYAQPENKELVEVLADMVSHEVFVSGGEKFTRFAELASILAAESRFGPAFAKLAGDDEKD